MTSTRDILLADIEAFLVSTGMLATTFGINAVNDPAFIQRLREGSDPRSSTMDRVRLYMQSERVRRRPLGRRRATEPRSAA